jgi:hypothetical protein
LVPKATSQRDFDVILRDVIFDVFKRCLGKAGAEMTFRYLEEGCGLKLNLIPSDLEAFSSNMARLLGSTSQVLDNLVIENLCRKLNLEYKTDSNQSTLHRIEMIKRRYEELKKRES